ncbi:thiol:disulfide interchange protein DsbA/DsbL [Thermomonas sp.]|jgi:thiol:disulfide interchange protein DsbA|uniref:thiol:disulfide interchange protein DsbA/DsbL n=1 Tax=Thermomonas sp. TaxID=1971895 RepID=UPI00258080E6|nr:thiol:disulfide interchange protein DsbA/DsbL [Thermomonas sp.]
MRALLLSLALLLTTALAPAQAQRVLPGLTDGVQYRYVDNGQPYRPLPPGMVEVAEVFAYTCPHCAHFSPMLEAWAKQLPAHARLVLVPGVYDRDDPWPRVFFAAQAAKSLPVLHPRLFAAIHETGELPRNADAAQILAFASRVQGSNATALKIAMANDAKLLPQLKQAYEFGARSQIDGTPSLIVAGRYVILGNSYESLLGNARAVVAALAPKQKPKATARPAPAKPASPRS